MSGDAGRIHQLTRYLTHPPIRSPCSRRSFRGLRSLVGFLFVFILFFRFTAAGAVFRHRPFRRPFLSCRLPRCQLRRSQFWHVGMRVIAEPVADHPPELAPFRSVSGQRVPQFIREQVKVEVIAPLYVSPHQFLAERTASRYITLDSNTDAATVTITVVRDGEVGSKGASHTTGTNARSGIVKHLIYR